MQFYKKKLRSMQRELEASLRINKCQKIMELHEGNDAGFYSLVRKQRDPANTTTSSLTFNDISLNNDNLIRDAWMEYFQDLATPMDSENFDKEHFNLVENDIKHFTKTFNLNQLGACIGPIYFGIPTVADDVALISTDPYELQTMLNVQTDHANKLKYILSEQKSTILVYNDKLPKSWSLNGKSVTLSESAVHLGIERNITKNTGVKEVVTSVLLLQGKLFTLSWVLDCTIESIQKFLYT
ncbi:CAPZA [Mytilus coruscus]|uniref:CAPZA n=1 Tax=Mytilus coruscus TaxID=42192 RepID=A0A6J8A6W6_MYTCO|nr:CAPZA [Mytilus coruscus]